MELSRRSFLLRLAGGCAGASAGLGLGLSGAAALDQAMASGQQQGSEQDQAIPKPLPRIANFEKMAYGMFIHWGLYSQLGQGEWAMNNQRIPVTEYKKLRDTFTAKDFDGRKIARLAKRAGMKYITLTSRHHEGFSLYDTRGLSDYDVMHAPAKRDLIKNFVEGCRAEGIAPFLYHTTLDWYQESYREDFDAYLDYLHNSVEVLCTHYGKLGGLWFDGNWHKPNADWKENRLYGMIRKLQPEAIIVNNTGLEGRGALGNPEIDSVTFEQGRPTPMGRRGAKKYVMAEMCQTMNRHWGIGSNDFYYMSPKGMIENLCACRKVGANYLLNVGPTAEGAIPAYEAAALARTGDWLSLHQEAVYDAKPCGVAGKGPDFGLKTKDHTYLFIHNLSIRGSANVTLVVGGTGPRAFTGLRDKVNKAVWLDTGEQLKFEQNMSTGEFTLNATRYPYGTNTVVRIARLSV